MPEQSDEWTRLLPLMLVLLQFLQQLQCASVWSVIFTPAADPVIKLANFLKRRNWQQPMSKLLVESLRVLQWWSVVLSEAWFCHHHYRLRRQAPRWSIAVSIILHQRDLRCAVACIIVKLMFSGPASSSAFLVQMWQVRPGARFQCFGIPMVTARRVLTWSLCGSDLATCLRSVL